MTALSSALPFNETDFPSLIAFTSSPSVSMNLTSETLERSHPKVNLNPPGKKSSGFSFAADRTDEVSEDIWIPIYTSNCFG